MRKLAIALAALGAAVAGVVLAAQAPPGGVAATGTMVEYSSETRFQLDVQVPSAALAAYLPTGWTPNVATQGAAKDANLRVIFIDRLTINGPDGKPVGKGSNRLVYLAAPVREPGGMNVQLVIGGITEDPADAPGPFGNYLLATTHVMRRSTTAPASGSGPTIETQDWDFAAVTGERLQLHLNYEKGVANKAALTDVRFYSAKTPAFFQISRQEQVLDIMRNVTTNPPDRVKEFSFKGSGGSYARLFDGTEKALSWDNILWINRTVLQPSSGPGNAAALDYEYFKTRVQPIFLAKRPGHARCIACHGQETTPLDLQPLPAGRAAWTEEESRKNFEAIRHVAAPGNLKSKLLLHALEEKAGGDFYHNGGKHFASQDDPEWQILKAWVMGQTAK